MILAGSKKYRFFKPINKGAFYELDIEKIQEDQKYDGTMFTKQTNRFISKRLLIYIQNNDKLSLISRH